MKKGIVFPTEFLIRLAIGIMFAVLIVIIGCKVFTIDTGANAAQESFEKLVMKIEQLPPDDVASHELVLDEGGALIGLTKSAESVRYTQSGPRPSAFFRRPSECSFGKSCLCLCKKLKMGLEFTNQELICDEKLICSNFKTLDFPSMLTKSDYFSEQAYHLGDYEFKNGFIIQRGEGTNLPRIMERSGVLYIERRDATVTICDHKPCLKP